MKEELPKRKHPRLNHYDYARGGSYFITICTQNRKCILSNITSEANVVLSKMGKIAETELFALQNRFDFLILRDYVIMPDHIHIIFSLTPRMIPPSPRPTVNDIICAYKALTAKECKKCGYADKLFQASFFEHIVRGREDYNEIVKYIRENPMRWYYDELHAEE